MLFSIINKWLLRFFSNLIFFSSNTLLSFINTSILIFLLGAYQYGRYQFILSIISIFTFFNFLDSAIERNYYSLKDFPLVSSIIKLKSCFFLIILIFYCLFGNKIFLPLSFHIIIIIFLTLFFESIINSFNFVLLSNDKYKVINKITYFKNFSILIFLLIFFISFDLKIEFYIIFIFILTLINLILFIYKSDLGDIKKTDDKIKILDFYFKNKPILLPVLLTQLSGYIKTHFPTLLFGFQNDFTNATFTRIVVQIFQTLHKLLNASTGRFLSIIKSKDFNNMKSKASYYNFLYLVFVIFVFFLVFIFCLFYTKEIINLEINSEIVSYIALISFAFLFLSATHKNTIFLKLKYDYSFLYYTAPGNLFFIPAISFLFYEYELLSLAFAYLTANYYMFLVITYFAYKNYIISINSLFRLMFFYSFFIAIMILITFNFF